MITEYVPDNPDRTPEWGQFAGDPSTPSAALRAAASFPEVDRLIEAGNTLELRRGPSGEWAWYIKEVHR